MNAKFNGMAAIHKAAIAGKTPVLKALVELGADIELEVVISHYFHQCDSVKCYTVPPVGWIWAKSPSSLCS